MATATHDIQRIDFDPTNASKGAEGEICVIGHEVTNPPSSPSSAPPLPAANRGRVVVPLSVTGVIRKPYTERITRERKRK